MAEPFLGEIRMVGFNFAPRGWAMTDGQILPINQNQSLYSLLGTTYGGDGRTSFALPDLRSRTPVHFPDTLGLGQRMGLETVTLSLSELPDHTHYVRASESLANQRNPTGRYIAAFAAGDTFREPETGNRTFLRSGTVANEGGQQPHDNMQPYLVVTFCIALQGLFPSRN